MRYRLMATYCGAPYQAGLGPDGTEVTLFAACPPPEELGFSCAAGHWRKQVDISDLDALWQSRPVGDYRGDPCLVLDDLGDRLHIVYLGRDAVLARQLGYWEVDREVFEVVVPRHEVTDLAEERDEIPLAIDVVKRAQFFLLVLDEDVPEAARLAEGGAITEEALQLVPHPARVYLYDLAGGKEIARVRREGASRIIPVGERMVTDPETREAMQRQANNCALANLVTAALAPPLAAH